MVWQLKKAILTYLKNKKRKTKFSKMLVIY